MEKETIFDFVDYSLQMDNNSGIYIFLNHINDYFYIGSSKNMRKRKNNHLCGLRHNKHHNKHLQNSFNKHGESSFEFFVLENSIDLQKIEQYWMDKLINFTTYNILKKAYSISGKNHPMFGKKHTKEAITKIKSRRANQIIKHSEETKKKIGDSNRGKTMSEESNEKNRKAHLGKIPWNKGLTADSNSTVKSYSEKRKQKIDVEVVILSYELGNSINSISKEFKYDWDAVKRTLKENNIHIRTISEQKIIRDNLTK